MRVLLIILTILLTYGFSQNSDCGDGTVYANKKQTKFDDRFGDYPKISGVPKFKGGDTKLNSIVLENLKLSDVAKTQIFRLNYQFTVTCEGKIKDVKQIGNPMVDGWTNIINVIQSIESDWTPAKNKGKTVDCIYFSSLTINGSKY